VARLASLIMKVGALGFALELNKTFSINLQLLGGIWILQTFPAIVIGLYTRWFHRFALIIGWASAMAYGTIQAYRTPGGGQAHFGASTAPVFGHVTYIAISALLVNLVVAVMLTLIFRAIGLPDGYDETRAADYSFDSAGTLPATAGARGGGLTDSTLSSSASMKRAYRTPFPGITPRPRPRAGSHEKAGRRGRTRSGH
jgi:SSS family solute:Na+ symporter